MFLINLSLMGETDNKQLLRDKKALAGVDQRIECGL